MKTYRLFVRGCIYSTILIAVILGFSFSKVSEKNEPQTAVNIEVVQELGNKDALDEEVIKEARKAYEQKRAAEKKRVEALANKNIGTSKGAHILMYHYIGDTFESYMSVSKARFRDQMKYLKENGFNVISLDELYSYYINNTQIPDKSVVITFDDGYADNYTRAYPILKEFGFKAMIFVITSKINQDGYMTSEQLRELDSNGIDIECHTVNHSQLSLLPSDRQVYELSKSKLTLEALLQRDIKYISYPYGDFNEDTILTVHQLHYNMAMATTSGRVGKLNNIYSQYRTPVSGNFNIEQFKTLLKK